MTLLRALQVRFGRGNHWLTIIQQNIHIGQLHAQIEQMELDHARNVRDLLIQFRISRETPNMELDDLLDAAISDLSDQVARYEEHVT